MDLRHSPLDPALPVYGYRPADTSAAPAVSIITPYYNTGPVFMDTVRSVLRQSLQQWEWLVVNDGSDDPEALRALLPLRSADSRIRVIDQPNRGLPAARNAGAAASRAPLLFFLDSDDMLAPTALEKLAWTLESHPGSAFAGAWTRVFGHQNTAWPRGFDTRAAFLYENMANPAAMVRRAAFERVGGFDEARRAGLEDYEFWLRCAAHGMWGHDIHEYLIWLRRKAPAAYAHYRWAFQDDPRAADEFRHEMRARYPELFRRGLPRPQHDDAPLTPHAVIRDELPFDNRLAPSAGRRVLMILPWMVTGGAEQVALDVIAGLAERGAQVSVCLTNPAQHPWMERLLALTQDVFDLPAFLRPGDYPRFLRYLTASRGVDTIWISQSQLAYRLLPYLRAHCPGVRIVDYTHLEQPHRHGGMPRFALEHTALIDLHMVASDHLRRWMVERGAEPQRVAVCTAGVDERRWSPDGARRAAVRAELGVDEGTALILFAARLSAEKRARLAARVLRRLRDDGARFAAVFAGDGEDMPWLRMYLRRHRLTGQVRLLGGVPQERVRDLMRAADILLLPSEREGIALAVYQAMACGVVPVASDVGGQRELVTPDCGALVPLGGDEEAAYARELRALIDDPARRARMAAAGRERILGGFTLARMAGRVEELLLLADRLAAEEPRPAVDPGVARPAATLAIEHFVLETRLRHLPPVRLALRLRHSSFARPLARLLGLRALLEACDRAAYAARRTLARRVLGRS
ncbi:MAG: glycosyltransferase [Chloroflexota bacterium]|nr:MAG: glycosyl transferase family 1 [Chloroflexota bacterium]